MNQDSDESTDKENADKNAAKKPQGFGRRSLFDDNLKREVVMAWLKRDQSSHMNIDEFLAQKLGTRPDGKPRVGATTFYGWFTKIRDEMDKKE
jgi:hypothetical protein